MKHYIQFDLDHIHLLSGIATQGSPHSPRWVKQYYLTYSFDGKDWTRHKSFDGNRDQDSIVRHWFKPRFHARLVRIYPETWNGAICLRAEIYGCRVEGLTSSALQETSLFVPQGHFKSKDEHRVLCGSHKCHPYATCKVKSGKPYCTCALECKNGNKACGSDGHVYKSVCELKKKACEKNKLIKVAKPTKCVLKESALQMSDPDTEEDDKLDYSIKVIFITLILLSVIGLIMFAVIVTRWIQSRK
ncbi:contactin-associated protein-like 5 [Actinia tenebrosa]|uniref:Contactin-associated protein-like 5 n=1 Tax=Actinia tenebrosa TaxID=6105 RepID=A0A6P8I5I2_ACTTE|nr:contactin-associated protein-like 5 [Actinia tenebrosa]